MKLQLVAAGTGKRWVKLGVQTFLRQPLAFCGLFVMFMAVMSVLSLVPYLGNVLALMLLPGPGKHKPQAALFAKPRSRERFIRQTRKSLKPLSIP